MSLVTKILREVVTKQCVPVSACAKLEKSSRVAVSLSVLDIDLVTILICLIILFARRQNR